MTPGVQPWSKAGIIVKASTRQGAAYAALMVTGSHGVRMQWDFTHDVTGLAGKVSAASPRWLRLTRSGDTITGYARPTGRTGPGRRGHAVRAAVHHAGRVVRRLARVLGEHDVARRRILQGGPTLAAAVEFIHTATLLHDDVVDGSQLRRGKVAAHLIWGGSSSVLVGDFLFARAFELMVETGSLRALDILARASGVIAEGEVMQLTRSHDLNLDQATYIEIIRCKTAELFAAAAESGAVAAGAPEPQIAALRAFGLNLGLAFQLTDDALDYGGKTEDLGKNAGDDFREGKATMPLLLAIARVGPARSRILAARDRRPQADRGRFPPRPRADRRHGRPRSHPRPRRRLRRDRQAGAAGLPRRETGARRWKPSPTSP